MVPKHKDLMAAAFPTAEGPALNVVGGAQRGALLGAPKKRPQSVRLPLLGRVRAAQTEWHPCSLPALLARLLCKVCVAAAAWLGVVAGGDFRTCAPPRPPPATVWVFALGWIATAQAGVNVSLASALNNASLLAATFSVLLTGLILAAWSVGADMTGPPPRSPAKARRWPPWWKFLGGAVGFLYLGSSVVLVPRMGFSLYFVLLVSGSIAAGTAYDHYGVLGMPRAPIDRLKIVAVLMCVAGVVMNVLAGVLADEASRHGSRTAEISGEAVVTLAIGSLLPLQGLLNRALGADLRRPVEGATVQCFVNAACCAVGYAASLGIPGLTSTQGLGAALGRSEWWMWLGGLGGITLVYSGMTFIATVGVGPFFVLLTLGQLSSSLVWDATGTFAGGAPARLGWERYAGALMVMGAFLLLTYSRHLSGKAAAAAAPATPTSSLSPSQTHLTQGLLPGGTAGMPSSLASSAVSEDSHASLLAEMPPSR